MRRIDLLITQSRRATENVEFNDASGLGDEEFLQYSNDAQDRLQSQIYTIFPDIFLAEKEITATQGVEAFPIPDDAFLGSRIRLIEYTHTGLTKDYYSLKKGELFERISDIRSNPSFYIRRGNEFLIEPTSDTTSAKLRITYQKRLPRLDVRRGTVKSAVLDTGTNKITSLTLDTSVLLDDTALLEEDEITIIDKFGFCQMRRIQILAISTSTGVVTVDPDFTFETGETISAGNFSVRGPESTTHSQLPNIAERYIIAYMNWKILKRDSSNDSIEQTQELQVIEQDIINSFKQPDGDVANITILDDQFLLTDD